MGKPCVTTVRDMSLTVQGDGHLLSSNNTSDWIRSGDVITLDGGNGRIYKAVPPTMSLSGDEDFRKVLEWADQFRKLRVEAHITSSQDMCEQVKAAREVGADAIGCISTDGMFCSTEDRLNLTRSILVHRPHAEKIIPLRTMGTMQQQDLVSLFRCATHRNVVVKLLDCPLNRFLPSTDNEIVEFASHVNLPVAQIKQAVAHTLDRNPDIGLRGCRVSAYYPEITEMQVSFSESSKHPCVSC
jgi:pyruvate,orthophosphate dikinase